MELISTQIFTMRSSPPQKNTVLGITFLKGDEMVYMISTQSENIYFFIKNNTLRNWTWHGVLCFFFLMFCQIFAQGIAWAELVRIDHGTTRSSACSVGL